MQIVTPTYEILSQLDDAYILSLIERVGRVCYKSEDKITPDGESAKRLIRGFIKNHHHAMLEHGGMSVLFTTDRGVSHEAVRHRIASFAQESTRYVDYYKDVNDRGIMVIDPMGKILNDPKMKDLDDDTITNIINEWDMAIIDAEQHYFKLRELGCTPQVARDVLPHALKTDIVVTTNWREWRHIFNLRSAGTTGRPHPGMIELMTPLLKEVQQKVPVLFDDITPIKCEE